MSSVFPAFDTSQAGRAMPIDTTMLTDGLHTIAWIVTDSTGQSDGIGSRFFQVANGGAGSVAAAAQSPSRAIAGVDSSTIDAVPSAMSAIRARTGFDPAAPFETRYGSSDAFAITAEELDRLEVRLPPWPAVSTRPTCARSANCVRCRRARRWTARTGPSRGSRPRASSAITTWSWSAAAGPASSRRK